MGISKKLTGQHLIDFLPSHLIINQANLCCWNFVYWQRQKVSDIKSQHDRITKLSGDYFPKLKKCCNRNSQFWVTPGYFSLAQSGKMISRFVKVCWLYHENNWCAHCPRLLLLFLLLSVVLLVVTSGERDLARDTDGDGLRWELSSEENVVE